MSEKHSSGCSRDSIGLVANMCSAKQAGVIGGKLYVKTINQVHCADWCAKNLDGVQASAIVGKVIGLRYGTPDDIALPIVAEMRQRLNELGYVPREVDKSN